jgi:hypothetical protein
MLLEEIYIEKIKLETNHSSFLTKWVAQFINYNNGVGTSYNATIYPNLVENWKEDFEGGYPCGYYCEYKYEVEDIDQIDFIRDKNDGLDIETGALTNLNSEVKKLWLDELSDYMTKNYDLYINL